MDRPRRRGDSDPQRSAVKDGPGGAGDAEGDLPRPRRGRLPDVAPEKVAGSRGASGRPAVPAGPQEWPGDR